MKKLETKMVTVITADNGKYLLPKDLPEKYYGLIGQPIRLVYCTGEFIPEFEEREVVE